MRRGRLLQCVKGTTPSSTSTITATVSNVAAASVPTTPAPTVNPSVKSTVLESKPHRAFLPLRIQTWQTHSLSASQKEILPQFLLYHGTHLGPRPLIILDHTTKDTEDAMKAVKKYEPLLSQLSWDYGAVYIPLQVKYDDAPQDLLNYSCQQISAVMDAIDVRWTHFLTYSYGCLVAARMAASLEYPHRIGTLTSLDTPLITRELVLNMERREEIAKAERDVNVPEADLAFAKHTLLSSLESPLPCPATVADKALYEEYLFHPASIFHADGLIRRESRYVPVKHLADMRHPMQLVVPAANSVSDAGVHKEFFGLRRPVVVKGCQKHEDLFGNESAKELAAAMDTWLHRFEPDAFIAKRYEQAAKEMAELMKSSTPGTTQTETVKGAGEPRKKKEKKKKA
ncbi:uncharacterized protein TM35_000201990 [Trypanosoma theileri]|uniref:Uncharacterized protein n=1 Tax=Trypanosoma theileri TaxID=67003 RepID=A0A1X0NUK7_9TRYP|nr:uncharacterized protein TM35_000201990 [Trypanosoma theileri]ORC87790.1 hypothetical protein TM35_000201990 [Trypanosoma theileri]